MKNGMFITFICCLLTVVSFAQKGKKLTKEQKAELRSYYEQKIYPVRKAANDQFLEGLNADDVAFLETKKAEKKEINKAAAQVNKQLKELKDSGKSKEEMKAERKKAMAPIKEQKEAFRKSMEPFMERNKELITTSLVPVENNKATWKKDKEAMLDKFLSEEDRAKKDKRQAKKAAKRADNSDDQQAKMLKKASKNRLDFVLWNGKMKKKNKGKRKGKAKSSKKE